MTFHFIQTKERNDSPRNTAYNVMRNLEYTLTQISIFLYNPQLRSKLWVIRMRCGFIGWPWPQQQLPMSPLFRTRKRRKNTKAKLGYINTKVSLQTSTNLSLASFLQVRTGLAVHLTLTIVIVANSFLSAGSCVRHAGDNSCFLGATLKQRNRSRDHLQPIRSSISSQIIIFYYFSISLPAIEPLMDQNNNPMSTLRQNFQILPKAFVLNFVSV